MFAICTQIPPISLVLRIFCYSKKKGTKIEQNPLKTTTVLTDMNVLLNPFTVKISPV